MDISVTEARLYHAWNDGHLNMRFSKKVLVRLLRATVSFSVIYYLIRLVDWQTVGSLLASGTLLALWPGPLILLLGLVLAAERWKSILRHFNLSLSTLEATSIYLIGTFYGVLLPGVLGGDVVRVALCRQKTSGSTASILGSVGIERVCGLWGVVVIGSLGALGVSMLMPDAVNLSALLLSPVLALSIPLTFLIAFYFLDKIEQIKRLPEFVKKGVKLLGLAKASLTKLPPSLIFSTLLLSTAFQASEILIYYYFGMTLGIDVPFIFYLFLIPIVYLSTVLPISLGGIGVREGVLVFFMAAVGVTASNAAFLAFLVYLNRIFVALIGGLAQASGGGTKSSGLPEIKRS